MKSFGYILVINSIQSLYIRFNKNIVYRKLVQIGPYHSLQFHLEADHSPNNSPTALDYAKSYNTSVTR